MRTYILSLPEKLQPVVIIGSTVVAAFAVSLLTRMFFHLPQLLLDSALTSSVYGALGTIYAVLIAFVVTGVWQSFTTAGAAVNSEANALSDLLFVIRYISVERTGTAREMAKAYVRSVVERWDLLSRATIDKAPVEEINLETSSALLKVNPGNQTRGRTGAGTLRASPGPDGSLARRQAQPPARCQRQYRRRLMGPAHCGSVCVVRLSRTFCGACLGGLGGLATRLLPYCGTGVLSYLLPRQPVHWPPQRWVGAVSVVAPRL